MRRDDGVTAFEAMLLITAASAVTYILTVQRIGKTLANARIERMDALARGAVKDPARPSNTGQYM